MSTDDNDFKSIKKKHLINMYNVFPRILVSFLIFHNFIDLFHLFW